MSEQAGTRAAVRRRLVVRGVVQGVGFRPHVARLAHELGLSGCCRNDTASVVVEVEGPSDLLDAFGARLVDEAPPLARVHTVESADLAPLGGDGFTIDPSAPAAGARTMVPPDAATCDDCLRELLDPADRRHRHPFLSCTHCGPRFTITWDLPYDRPLTTMAGFALCDACAREYADPADRRYHAQPIACHDCGPRLRLIDPGDPGHLADHGRADLSTEEVLAAVRTTLSTGRIVAVKGIGGYHLVCDATDEAAVARLRERKHRPHQPLAVMVPDLATARAVVDVPAGADEVLTGPERPIVLLPRAASSPVATGVAPGLGELGVLLAYTPLHHLLLAHHPDDPAPPPPALVVTSGNLSGEPLAFRDDDALARLGAIADLLVAHDREIAVPCEDSVVAWSASHGAVPVRRSRGYAPLPLPLAGHDRVVLAAGAEIKNTFALTRDGQAFVSAHLGDLGSLEAQAAYATATSQLLRFHRCAPDLVVADRHPAYASRAWAARFADDLGVPLVEVQHHHAHLAALAAEHGRLDEPLLGLVLDGTGYGCDATVWGGELLLLGGGGATATRLGHLADVPLPGGDAGVRNPVRVAAALMLAHGIDLAGTPVADELTPAEHALLAGTGRGWTPTSSAGRLFDAVSSLLGVRHRVTYEAQAAIELEALATTCRQPVAALAGDLVGPGQGGQVLAVGPLVSALADLVRAGTDPARLALAFHVTLADGLVELARRGAAARGAATVGLSGGVFGNRLLLALVSARLAEVGLEPLTHRRVPANDGGLALGQAAVGLRVPRPRASARPDVRPASHPEGRS